MPPSKKTMPPSPACKQVSDSSPPTLPPSPGCNHMSDTSPPIQRQIRRKAPVITTSQDSPERPPYKSTVPPSAGGSALDDVLPSSQCVSSPFKSPSSSSSQQGLDPLATPSGAPATPSHEVPSTTVATPKPKRTRRSKRQVSRRQQMLKNPFLDLQAVECDSSGASVEGSQNSEDDRCVPAHPPPVPAL
jgi:hypothetical protein